MGYLQPKRMTTTKWQSTTLTPFYKAQSSIYSKVSTLITIHKAQEKAPFLQDLSKIVQGIKLFHRKHNDITLPFILCVISERKKFLL